MKDDYDFNPTGEFTKEFIPLDQNKEQNYEFNPSTSTN
jgi:hypothetical protein